MEILSGLFSHMVTQRSGRVSDIRITGTTKATGPVLAKVVRNKKTVAGWAAKKIGVAGKGKFSAVLKGLPLGGPYDLTLTIGDESRTVVDVLVGDVWIVAGQSNMEGYGEIKWKEKPHKDVRAFIMSDNWAVAQDPIHELSLTVDEVHVNLNGNIRPSPKTFCGTGPGVAFGQALNKLTGVPIGLIPCAHGGTSMDQWSPELKKEGTKSLYGATYRRVTKNGGRVAGVIWYQGENDANPEPCKTYRKKMVDLVKGFRKDFGDPKLPFIGAQLSKLVIDGKNDGQWWNKIQDEQRIVAETVPNVAFLPTHDLALDDLVHIGRDAHKILGQRMAQAALTIQKAKGALPPQIKVKKIGSYLDADRKNVVVTVEFENVVGKLRVPGEEEGILPNGFEVLDSMGNHKLYDTVLKGKTVHLRSFAFGLPADCLQVQYAAGLTAHANVRDEAGRPILAFGPLPVGKPRAMTPLLPIWDVSEFQPSAGKLEGLKYPQNQDTLGFKARGFSEPSGFSCLREEIVKQGNGNDRVIYYRAQVECPEDMKLKVLFGYDGPFKLWIDQKEVFFDPKGTNPALMDSHEVPFTAAKGKHEILVALGTNGGCAWGIFLRFWRLDVSRKQVEEKTAVLPILPKL